MSTKKEWLPVYLYYTEPWEPFLVNAIKPFAEKALKEKWAERFFFIRYWERGPHLRLRFWGDPSVLEEQLKPALVAHFEGYMEQHPSKREEPKSMPEGQEWYPNNSLQFIPYEPEIERYGGPVAITVGEEEFMASSESILALLEDEDLEAWDYSRALGSAIQLHLGMAVGCGMNLEQAKTFFTRIYEGWLPRAYYFFEKDISDEELAKRRKETLEAFEATYEQQKDAIVPYVVALWNALEEGAEFDKDWLNNWVVGMQG